MFCELIDVDILDRSCCASDIFSIVVESMTVLADDGFEDDCNGEDEIIKWTNFEATVIKELTSSDKVSKLPDSCLALFSLANNLCAFNFNSFGCGVFWRTNGVWNESFDETNVQKWCHILRRASSTYERSLLLLNETL